jgi:ATP/maltotriose-dependent transcriptional regulator MalT
VAERGLEDVLACGYTYGEDASYQGDIAEVRWHVRPVLVEDRATTNPGYLLPLLEMTARTEADGRSLDPDPEEGAWIIGRVEHLVDILRPRNARDDAYAAHIRAEVARWRGRDTVAMWASVVDRWRQVERPQPLARALLRWGESLGAQGRRGEARQALAEALRISEQLHAGPQVDQALAAARRCHLRLASATPALAADLGLTDRELEVLRLIAAGASNATIGKTLFISPKTVSVHVSHILTKLGVPSRGAAVAKAQQSALRHEASLFGT